MTFSLDEKEIIRKICPLRKSLTLRDCQEIGVAFCSGGGYDHRMSMEAGSRI